jgi:hypothetical protein
MPGKIPDLRIKTQDSSGASLKLARDGNWRVKASEAKSTERRCRKVAAMNCRFSCFRTGLGQRQAATEIDKPAERWQCGIRNLREALESCGFNPHRPPHPLTFH